MGQQQLLLLVLGIVLVGLAVVVGISAFGENQKKTNLDQLTSDAVRLAAGVQAWKMKPVASGGGQSDPDYSRFSFAQLGITPTGTGQNATYDTSSGSFRIKPYVVTGAIAGYAQAQYGITDTGNAVAVVALSKDATQSVMIVMFASAPSKMVTILQHPFNVTAYNAPPL
jgi:hypothetical protein